MPTQLGRPHWLHHLECLASRSADCYWLTGAVQPTETGCGKAPVGMGHWVLVSHSIPWGVGVTWLVDNSVWVERVGLSYGSLIFCEGNTAMKPL